MSNFSVANSAVKSKTSKGINARVERPMSREIIYLLNNLVEMNYPSEKSELDYSILGTLLSNFSYYGYTPSKDMTVKLMHLSEDNAKKFWASIEPGLKSITGEDKNMGKYVVYKNFPEEVLNMSEGEYWVKQILMYWGLPNELFTQGEKSRPSKLEKIVHKVLQIANDNSLKNIFNSLLQSPTRWTEDQNRQVSFLLLDEKVPFTISDIPFKENFVAVAKIIIENGLDVAIKSSMDVLRLAVGMSGGDVSMREKSKFRSFTRKERKFLLSKLEGCSSLYEDMARDKNKWKKFVRNLHPNEYASLYPKVCKCYDSLYRGEVRSFNSKVEGLYNDINKEVLLVLQSRPGDFMRRLYKMIEIFEMDAVNAFSNVLNKLSTIQLLKIRRYISTINSRKFRTFPPKGNWKHVQIVPNTNHISSEIRNKLIYNIDKEVSSRMSKIYGSVNLDPNTEFVKIQDNGSELSPYGRGTVFTIPDNITFIRSASYWQILSNGYVWFDNGWNFFDEDWNVLGSCCWVTPKFKKNAAVFSGDPTNTKEMEGKACQMIDLYLPELKKAGVRYAIWNILCFSGISFDKAKDVYAAMQWGENPTTGKLFEPSRCQLSFPVSGKSMTKYILLLDVEKRQVVYIDANLNGNVRSAESNGEVLKGIMPAYMEYLETIPTIHDLFKGVRKSRNGVQIAYSDKDLYINGCDAYVFKPENQANKFNQININELLK